MDAGEADAAIPIDALLRVDEVVITQGVEITLALGDVITETRTAPIVRGREGLLRVLVTPLAGSISLHAELAVMHGGTTDVVPIDATIAAPSDRGVLGSTLDFPLAPELVEADTSVVLPIDVAGATELRWPETPLALEAESTIRPVRVALVPIVSAGVMPALGPDELAQYRERLLDLYPIADVELSVIAEEAFDPDLCMTGEWTRLQTQLAARRALDAPADGVGYCGVVARADFRCADVGGLAPSGIDDPAARAFAIYGIDPRTPRDSPTVLAHELGHSLGRLHSPCGLPAGPDPEYPHEAGLIGAWGWSASRDRLLDPTLYTDMMGYCAPVWISDYTYAALFDAIVTVHTAEGSSP